jgi:endonuclease-3
MMRITLSEAVASLQTLYGLPKRPLSDPWLLVLWENIAYLADDRRRQQALNQLIENVGSEPQAVLCASDDELMAIGARGIVAKQTVKKLRRCAEIVIEEFGGDLRSVLKLPLAKAVKALQKFPGIGVPGAEKILLFCRAYPVFGLESNGLRVLLRLGFGADHKNYSSMYRLVRQDIENELQPDYEWMIRAHQLLRRHGQDVCRRTQPKCEECPLAAKCLDYQSRIGKPK